jgi:hypothetical protein
MSTILCKISSYHLNTQAGSAQRLELQLPSSRAVYSCVRIATISRTEGGQPQALVRSSDAHSQSRQPYGTMPVLRRRAPNLNYAPHGLHHPARRSDWRTPPNVLGVSGGQYRSLRSRLRRPLDAMVGQWSWTPWSTSSRTPTSRFRFATFGHPAQDHGSHPVAARAATDIPADPRVLARHLAWQSGPP